MPDIGIPHPGSGSGEPDVFTGSDPDANVGEPGGAFVASAGEGESGSLPLTGGTMTGPFATTPVALADAATIAVNAALGNDFYVTLGGDRTLGAPSSPADRQIIRIDVIQPASGGPYTLSYNAIYDFGSGSAPTLSSAASKVDTLAFRYIASISKWTYLGTMTGF